MNTTAQAIADLRFAIRLLEAGDLDRAARYAALGTQVIGTMAAPVRYVNGEREVLRPAEYVRA